MRHVDVDTATDRKYPERVNLLVTPDSDGGANVMPCCWVVSTSHDPSMLAVSAGKSRYTHGLMQEADEFVLAFPTPDQQADVLYCGQHTGAEVDKFAETDLEPEPAAEVDVPLVADTVACFECRARGSLETGDHTLFAGEVVAGHVSDHEEKLFNFGNFDERGTEAFSPVTRRE